VPDWKTLHRLVREHICEAHIADLNEGGLRRSLHLSSKKKGARTKGWIFRPIYTFLGAKSYGPIVVGTPGGGSQRAKEPGGRRTTVWKNPRHIAQLASFRGAKGVWIKSQERYIGPVVRRGKRNVTVQRTIKNHRKERATV